MEFLSTGVCNNYNTENIKLAVFFSKVFNQKLTSWLETVENPISV